jgi:hypothetical protein
VVLGHVVVEQLAGQAGGQGEDQPGQVLVVDRDQALGQLVETISHSSIWSSSTIFVFEDDSHDGADHVNAHRIPAMVILATASGQPARTDCGAYQC